MPPPDRPPMPPLPGRIPARIPRDLRIDTFRGIALVMIFINHVPGNPFEILTIRNFGFSDAAEAFFLLSGTAAALAYAGRFQPGPLIQGGLWTAVRPIWRRAWQLYLVQIFLTVWAIALFAAGAQLFGLPELLRSINLRQVFENPAQALIGIPLLTHQLGYVNILPAYSVLLVLTPLALMMGLRHPWLLAGLSAGLWLAAGLWRLNLPNYPNPGGWFFNPFAWQAIFVAGLLTGLALRRGTRLVPQSQRLFWLAFGFLILVLCWRYVPGLGAFLNHQMARLGAMGLPFNLVSHDKTFLALPRLLHILALAYVLSCLPWVAWACGHPLAAPLRLLGRHGLLVFSAGTLLSLVCQVIMAGYPASAWAGWVLPPLGVAVMLAVAGLAERNKAPRAAPAQPAIASAGAH